jgi:hypothetical protein
MSFLSDFMGALGIMILLDELRGDIFGDRLGRTLFPPPIEGGNLE